MSRVSRVYVYVTLTFGTLVYLQWSEIRLVNIFMTLCVRKVFGADELRVIWFAVLWL